MQKMTTPRNIRDERSDAAISPMEWFSREEGCLARTEKEMRFIMGNVREFTGASAAMCVGVNAYEFFHGLSMKLFCSVA